MNGRYLRCLIVSALFLLLPQASFAATLFIAPASASVAVGQAVSVSIDVGSPTQALNAIAATLHFPTDLLRVSSISKNGSILSLWVQDPTFSNTSGTVNFSGVIPNPGFTGGSGRVVTVTFIAKKEGVASVTLSDDQVLANDGSGTNIFTGHSGGKITIIPAPQVEVQPSQVNPAPPEITCPAPVTCEATTTGPTLPMNSACIVGPWGINCIPLEFLFILILIFVFFLGVNFSRRLIEFADRWRQTHPEGADEGRFSWTSPLGLGFFLLCVGIFILMLHFAGVLG